MHKAKTAEEVQELLNQGVDVDEIEDSRTALHAACIKNDVEKVKVLLDHGADIEREAPFNRMIPPRTCLCLRKPRGCEGSDREQSGFQQDPQPQIASLLGLCNKENGCC
jgi:hypothetical protein